jgi:hypothetical protein
MSKHDSTFMMRGRAAVLVIGAGVALAAALPDGAGLAQGQKGAKKQTPRKPPARPGKPRPGAAAAGAAQQQTVLIAQIEKAGGRVGQIAQTDDRLEVTFRMQGSAVTDAALAPLRGLKKVAHLDLGHTAVTDAGLVNIKGLGDLTELHLEETKITDRGLANLKDLRNLEYLNLYATGITDAGLEQLAGLTKLRHLYVWQTKVTDAGVEKLKKTLSQLEIVRGWDQPPKP